MKSILISIQPRWCELIANGKKTVDVRKTRPKLETPFKVYIYCTQARIPIDDLALTNRWGQGKRVENPCGMMISDAGELFLNGKVMGEFVCDRIIDIPYSQYFIDYYHTMPQNELKETSLDMGMIDEYLLSKNGYGWHISDLVIYDEPKELHEFKRFCTRFYDGDHCEECKYFIDGRGYEYDESDCGCDGLKPLKRPPQSWCYVDEVQDNG